jgi:hypothetical protein
MTENPVSIGDPRTKIPGAIPFGHRINGALETGFETGFLSGGAMSFREWQPQYASHGIATFPVVVGPHAVIEIVGHRKWRENAP